MAVHCHAVNVALIIYATALKVADADVDQMSCRVCLHICLVLHPKSDELCITSFFSLLSVLHQLAAVPDDTDQSACLDVLAATSAQAMLHLRKALQPRHPGLHRHV